MSTYHLRKQFAALWITRNWIGVLVFWIFAAVLLRWYAPSLESVSQDGDLQFLPSSLPSRVGQRLLEEAFPGQQSKSRMVLIVAREDAPLLNEDLAVAFDLGRRINYFVAANILKQSQRLEPSDERKNSLEMAKSFLDISIQMDSNWFDAVKAVAPENTSLLENRWTSAFEARADTIDLLLSEYSNLAVSDLEEEKAASQRELLEELSKQVQSDRNTAELIRKSQPSGIRKSQPNGIWAESAKENSLEAWQAIFDVWTWEDSLLGNKLGASHPSGRMIVLQLSNEFMAVDNVRLVQSLETLISDVRSLNRPIIREGLEVGVSGPAAVGADMLRAAGASVRQTEIISILMVLGILVLIYRAPLLVLIPLFTILLSLSIAISVVSLLSDQYGVWQSVLPGLKVFSTTKIFLVVLLFGMGTDFCLFLISRCREEIVNKAAAAKPITNRKAFHKAVAVGWVGVFDALVGSAFTTATGLAMMYFSAFEKFRYNGIVIAISILITLVICLTFTPALLCAFGRVAFWPMSTSKSKRGLMNPEPMTLATDERATESVPSPEASAYGSGKTRISSALGRGRGTASHGFWSYLAKTVIRAPIATLMVTVAVLCIPAYEGWVRGGNVTYDFLTELNSSAPSRRGTELIERFFTTRDNSPVTIVIVAEKPFSDIEALSKAVEQLGNKLYLEGVTAVRSISDPLGDYPPDKRMGLFDPNAWRRRLLKNHRITTTYYASPQKDQLLKTARMDLLLSPNPFSVEAKSVLSEVSKTLSEVVLDSSSPWFRANFAYTGTTAGIADLKDVTQSDQARIQWMVTLGVGAILFWLLRSPWLSLYLMLTVLLSYFSTLGLTQWFFAWVYGADFVGLDWKVPLLLFVILVAVGQDYNVYLVTRVFEEQSKHGMVDGLYRGIVATGGIITSCGLVMAATFFSMTMAGFLPWFSANFMGLGAGASDQSLLLRGILELGFALGLGVLIDTFLVRTVLVPAMMSWMIRFQKQ